MMRSALGDDIYMRNSVETILAAAAKVDRDASMTATVRVDDDHSVRGVHFKHGKLWHYRGIRRKGIGGKSIVFYVTNGAFTRFSKTPCPVWIDGGDDYKTTHPVHIGGSDKPSGVYSIDRNI